MLESVCYGQTSRLLQSGYKPYAERGPMTRRQLDGTIGIKPPFASQRRRGVPGNFSRPLGESAGLTAVALVSHCPMRFGATLPADWPREHLTTVSQMAYNVIRIRQRTNSDA
jgi:hypothetical protein